MTFAEKFQQSVTGKMIANYTIDPNLLLPNQYRAKDACDPAFLSLLGGGSMQSKQLFSVTFAPMEDVYLLLYTTKGAGLFQTYERSKGTPLSENSVLFWDCGKTFTLSTSILPWNFLLFFLSGEQLHLYFNIAEENKSYYHTPPSYSPLHRHFRTLLGIPECYSLSDALKMHQLLTNILTDLTLPLLPKETVTDSGIPAYLYELKDRLDHHYAEPFSLSRYEELFSINRYRICREFSRYFDASPLAYLTRVRLDAAKEMLLTTDLNIYEVSSYVGYENVNHFISLFRKYNGITPGAFKQKAPGDQHGSRSLSE